MILVNNNLMCVEDRLDYIFKVGDILYIDESSKCNNYINKTFKVIPYFSDNCSNCCILWDFNFKKIGCALDMFIFVEYNNQDET